jgi:hypothetical protein
MRFKHTNKALLDYMRQVDYLLTAPSSIDFRDKVIAAKTRLEHIQHIVGASPAWPQIQDVVIEEELKKLGNDTGALVSKIDSECSQLIEDIAALTTLYRQEDEEFADELCANTATICLFPVVLSNATTANEPFCL